MATLAAPAERTSTERAERRFYFIMALAMAASIVAGFSFNLAMGRSSFAVPAIVHVHAVIFFAWVGLFVVQAGLINAGNARLHRRLGIVSLALVPIMVVVGVAMMVSTLRRTGGPFFFDQNVFLFSNIMLLGTFGGMVFWALRVRRYSGWHRRLMLVAIAMVTGPGLGRLLPVPLLIPHAWTASVLSTLVFPLAAMIADKRRHGRVHPALWWGTGVYMAVFALSLLLAEMDWAIALTRDLLAGTPGADRPMRAFLPPGFAV